MSKLFRYFITVDEDSDGMIGEIADRRGLEQDRVASLLIKYAAEGITASKPAVVVDHIDTPTITDIRINTPAHLL